MAERALANVAVERGLVGGPFGSSLVSKDYVDAGVPVIRGNNMLQPYIGGEFAYVTREKAYRDLARNTAVPGDLVFTQRGTLGQVSIVPEYPRREYVISQSQMRLRVDEAKADPRFVYYACQRPEFVKQISDNAIATGVPHINLGILGRLTIPDLSCDQQRAIAEVLGALDDKIATNDRLVKLVDDLLRAAFQGLAAGRTWSKLCEIGDVNVSVTKPQVSGSLRYLDISSVGSGTYDFPEMTSWVDAPGRARRVLRAGDTVWSTVRPNRRSHALILDDDSNLIASTGLAVLSPHPGRVAGLYEATRTDEFGGYLESVAEGSAYPAVRGDRFLDAPVPSLEANEWERFEDLALPMRRRAHTAVVESRSLATARDELLPLLMSGKVRVKDAETVVEEVT